MLPPISTPETGALAHLRAVSAAHGWDLNPDVRMQLDPDSDADNGDDEGQSDAGDAPEPDAGVKKALAAERKLRREAEAARKAAERQLAELRDAGKPDEERSAERIAAAEERAAEAEARALRAEIANEKGLTAAQAKRLVGSTREELEADADELLETFPVKGVTPPPSQQPTPDLRGGSDPTEPVEEADPVKLADAIPRP